MNYQISDNLQKILRCPHCLGSLPFEDARPTTRCEKCRTIYPRIESGGLDLRLQQPKTYPYDFKLGTSLLPDDGFDFGRLALKNNPEVDFSGMDIPRHLNAETLSYFPRAKTDSSLMLDLGCGNMVHRAVSEHAGFEHVGLDYDTPEALIWGDAHSLPFGDNSFEFILSIAVLEHLRFPFLAMKEAQRVLLPGGTFIGTVAFLEPFHGDSYYHHSHLGVYNSLNEGGFTIEKIGTSARWTVLNAQAKMALFPKLPRLFSKLIVLPVQILHQLWWKAGSLVSVNAADELRIRNTAGAFTFIARK